MGTKLCHDVSHDWYQVGKCKDALGKHPCEYYPEGCETCMTRFECWTKDSDTYRSRLSGIFYACRKCPAVAMEGTMAEWVTHEIDSKSSSGRRRAYAQFDIRESVFIGMDKDLVRKLRDKWKK